MRKIILTLCLLTGPVLADMTYPPNAASMQQVAWQVSLWAQGVMQSPGWTNMTAVLNRIQPTVTTNVNGSVTSAMIYPTAQAIAAVTNTTDLASFQAAWATYETQKRRDDRRIQREQAQVLAGIMQFVAGLAYGPKPDSVQAQAITDDAVTTNTDATVGN